jgi:hypothetical protein
MLGILKHRLVFSSHTRGSHPDSFCLDPIELIGRKLGFFSRNPERQIVYSIPIRPKRREIIKPRKRGILTFIFDF